MASNQNVNKVVYAGTTLIDLTGDDVTAGDVLSGKKFHLPSGAAATGTIASQAAQTITPGTSDQTIAAGKYLSGAQTIKGDANLAAGNIKSGVTIFGVTGDYAGSSNGSVELIPNSSTFSTLTVGYYWDFITGASVSDSKCARSTKFSIDGVKAVTMTNSNYKFSVVVFTGTTNSSELVKSYKWMPANSVVMITESSNARAIAVQVRKISGSISSSASATIKSAFKFFDIGGSLMSFTIDSSTYQVEVGMTWRQWTQSSYCPSSDSFSIVDDHIYINNGNKYIVESSIDGPYVQPDDVISPSTNYYKYVSHGPVIA